MATAAIVALVFMIENRMVVFLLTSLAPIWEDRRRSFGDLIFHA
jgi:hypothetical protein